MNTSAKLYSWAEMEADKPMVDASRKRVIGQKMMMSRLELKKGCVVPMHSHENEQMCFIISGRIRFEVGEIGKPTKRTIVLSAGEVLHLPSDLPHAAFIEEDTVVLDLFSPPSATTGIDQHTN